MTDTEIDAQAGTLALAPVSGEPMALERIPTTATSQQMRVVEVSTALEPAYQRASMLELTSEEIAALTAPFPDTDIEIRPNDGLIYISHILISDRLNKVLMPGKWALVCRRHWIDSQPGKDKYGKDKIIQTMYGEYVLLIRGCFAGESTGGHQYQPDNPKVNYSDTLESTAAEALRRIAGKRLSCGSQVWHPQYARDWKDKYAAKEGGDWVKRIPLASRNLPPAPKSHVPPPQSAPQPTTVPNSPNPVDSAKSPETPKTTQEKAKARMLELLASHRDKAFAYFLFRDWIVDTQDIEDLPLERVPVNKAEMDMMLKCVQTFEIDPVPTSASQQCEKPRDWHDYAMPWGQFKGEALGDLDRKYLFGQWANYVPLTEYNNKPLTEKQIADNEEFREVLDEMGAYYKFEKRD